MKACHLPNYVRIAAWCELEMSYGKGFIFYQRNKCNFSSTFYEELMEGTRRGGLSRFF